MTSWPRAAPLVFALLVLSPPAWASPAPGAQDTSALRFRGFRAGATLEELDAVVRAGGGRLRCERARRDRRVSECRAAMHDSAIGGAVKVWASAVDSVASVITLAATVDTAAFDRWRQELETRYGRVGARAQGNQWMMQWVRRGRMLRLTWRIERGERTASVSLVDGRVLDAWGAQRPGASP